MKVVLVQPRGYPWSVRPRIATVACIMPPVGIASIAAVLRKAGHSVTIVDGALNYQMNNRQLAERIVAGKPDLVGFSATTSGFPDAYDCCRIVKGLQPEVLTVFGGVHASWGREQLLEEYPAIDYLIAGEGEEVLRRLADGDTDCDRLYFRNNGAVVHGTREADPIELDTLPYPAYDLLEGFPRKYLLPLFSYPRHPGATVISSRGCVYRCSYCDRSVFGKGFRWNSPEYTFGQIKWLHGEFGVRHVNFYDDLFTLNRGRVAALCEKLAEARLPVSFNCIVRIGHIDAELIALLKRGGCFMVSVGIESGDQSFLDSHKEGLALDAVRRDVELLHTSGLWVKGLFMMGFPGETPETIQATRAFALSLKLKDANMTAFTPFPGAPITTTINEHGAFDNDWSKLDCEQFVFIPNGISSREALEREQAQFYRQFYSRPFMRYHVYPKLLLQSPHSIWRLLRNAPAFLGYRRSMDKKNISGR